MRGPYPSRDQAILASPAIREVLPCPAGPVEPSHANRNALASMMIESLVVRPNDRVMVIPFL